MWRRRRRASIYEHVLAHVEPGTPGLRDGGEALPDEEEAFGGGVGWAPGALEGAFSRYAGPAEDTAERADTLHRALVRLADEPGRRARADVSALFRDGADRALMDEVLERLRDEPPADQGRLYAEARTILLETGNREELKFALALVGAFGIAEDAEIFRTLARHEEFTLYAAVALASTVDDPVGEWLSLLPDVSGWGATELSELLVAAEDERACGVLLRRGAAIGNALLLAVGCRLHEALQADDVDDDLFEGARSIIDDLARWHTGPETLIDYPDAGPAVERFLELLAGRASTLSDLRSAHGIVGFLEPGKADEPDDPEETAPELAEAGFDEDRVERIRVLGRSVVESAQWQPLVESALESEDELERHGAIEAAKILGLPLRDYLIRKIEARPNDSWLWFHLAFGADAERIAEVVRLAERVLDLDAFASGPALDLFGPPDTEGPHQAAGFVLQELQRYPGVGGRLLLAALESPVVRHRRQALDALSRWPRETVGDEMLRAVERRREDPDENVRAEAAAVLAGEPLPEDDD